MVAFKALHNGEVVRELLGQRFGTTSSHLESRTVGWTGFAEAGHHDATSLRHVRGGPLDVGESLGAVGKEVKRCSIVPDANRRQGSHEDVSGATMQRLGTPTTPLVVRADRQAERDGRNIDYVGLTTTGGQFKSHAVEATTNVEH